MSNLDIAIIVAYFALSLGVGLACRKRAGRSLAEYFVSGRSLPWWIAGTSMVATTFAADTPLAVTGLVVKYGLAGNWFWWSFALGGMVTAFVYAPLWRRAGVLTDVELVELRYGGKPAAALRGFRALYIVLLINPIIMGWVTGAMLDILKVTVLADSAAIQSGAADWAIIALLLGVTAVYSVLSGLWGVAITDFIQFTLAMAGCIVLAVIAVDRIGGVAVLHDRVALCFAGGDQAFRFLPDFRSASPAMPLEMFLVYLFVIWWASWYPGAEPGGGGFIVQRMASCRDERHSLLATLWFQVAHYCIRPWPWLMIAFVALAHYPNLASMDKPGVGFAMVIRDFAPAGLRGLMLVAFFAAFMSTISTQINWSASYLINDVYKRFIRPKSDDRHLARAARVASIITLLIGGAAAWLMRDISVDEAWKLLAALGAGTGAVFMLRWFWWRVNAWTEIAAMVASLVFFLVVSQYVEQDEYRLALVAGLTIAVWLLVTFLTPPDRAETLERFYRKAAPGGPGWSPVARVCPEVRPEGHLGLALLAALAATGVVYLCLPGVGFLIWGDYFRALWCLAGAGLCTAIVLVLIRKNRRTDNGERGP